MSYGTLADLVLILHLCYIAFVVFGQVLIMLGTFCRWNWVRNPWFRSLHLLAILFVVFEAFLEIECPLSTWEARYRIEAGQEMDVLRSGVRIPELSYPLFVLRKLLFPGSTQTVYTTIYVTFALLVVLFFFLTPPRWRRRAPKPEPAGNRNGQLTTAHQPGAIRPADAASVHANGSPQQPGQVVPQPPQ